MSALRLLVVALLLIVVAALAPPGTNWAVSLPTAGTIAAGGDHTCAVTAAGAVKCWGENGNGQLGDGTTAARPEPVSVNGLSGVTRVAAGLDSSCAVSAATGALSCWGANGSGQLGDGTTADRATPVPVAGLSGGVTDVALGYAHACAVAAGGVQCWGDNTFGQLGDGTMTGHNTPAAVAGLTSGVVAVVASAYSSCALTSAGAVKCWGDNTFGQLGDGTEVDRESPVDVTGLASGVAAIGAGGAGHACAAPETGGLKCWGNNEYGQLGENRGCPTPCTAPADVQGLADQVTAVTAGYLFTCASISSGAVRCWGNNQYGQVGDNQACGVLCGKPVSVIGLGSGVAAIAAGAHHACARAIGGVVCWGDNVSGQLGDGGECGTLCPAPVTVPGAQDFAAGDANCDHLTNSIDSAVVLQFVAGLIGSLPCAGPADVNGDGLVNAIDASLILQYEAGLLPRLPP